MFKLYVWFPFFVHENLWSASMYKKSEDFILIQSQLRMKGPSSQNTDQRTASDNGCQTNWKTTFQPSQGTAGGSVWSSYSSSSNQASAYSPSSTSDSVIKKLTRKSWRSIGSLNLNDEWNGLLNSMSDVY